MKKISLTFVLTMMAVMISLASCVVRPYDWSVESHREFVEKIGDFNSKHDEFVNTFISFDLDEQENVSNGIYYFVTLANNLNAEIFGVRDKICNTFDVYITYYLKSDTEDAEYSDHKYQVACYYRDKPFNFSEQDKIEIRKSTSNDGVNPSEQCNLIALDGLYSETLFGDKYYYKNLYHYEIYANDKKVACIHISSVDETNEEKLNEIIRILLDSIVIINSEEQK